MPWWCVLSLSIYVQEINTWIYSLSTALQEPVNFCRRKSKGLTHDQETAQNNRGKVEKKKIVKIFIFNDTKLYKWCITMVNGWYLSNHRIKRQHK